MKRIRVLMLVENNPYPADFRVRREALALRDGGYEVSVIAPRAPGQPWAERIDDIVVYRFALPALGHGALGHVFEFAWATLALLLMTTWVAAFRGVHVIHAANPPDTLCVIGLLARLLGRKFVFDHHDLAPEIYLARYPDRGNDVLCRLLRLLERGSHAAAHVVIATNESYRQRAITLGGKAPDRVFVVRNGPPASYRLLPVDPVLARRAKHLIGYVGTIGPQDGVDHWLRAVREMVFTLHRRDFLALVIGDGDALPALRRLAVHLGIEACVHFTGRLSEFESRRLLSATHVCVQPDPLNGLNDQSTMNKLMEYMALEKPTVAFDLAETRTSAQDAALYVSPNDELAFAREVCWLLDHPQERERMGRIGRQRISQALAWEHSVPSLLRAYAEGLGLAPSPSPAAAPAMKARTRSCPP